MTRSFLDIFDLDRGTAETIHASPDLIEAPNWTPDGKMLQVNGDGLLFAVPAAGGEPARIDTGFARGLNNDHGISPDGASIAISDRTETGASCIYIVPASGGAPRRVTREVPSWWHGWSPDSLRIAFAAIRGERFAICETELATGEERMVAGGDGPHYDGPDYTPDGRWIWFNSDRSGDMKLWRIPVAGGEAEQMSFGDSIDWFPHPSPDGRHVLYLAYPAGTQGHPRDLDVELRLMPAEGGAPATLLRFFGGQGSINVPCWAPDSRRFAFMRYARP